MAKFEQKMPKEEPAKSRDNKRDKGGWKANLRKARKAKGERRAYESGQ